MKKLFILLFLLLAILVPNVKAAEMSATESAIFKYNLAYPGILPDSPIYKLKILRDKITEILISDPKSRAEFFLLQADKGILTTSILVDKKEIKLAKQTALRAENNYTSLTFELKKIHNIPTELSSRIKTAALKHQLVLNSIIEKVDEKDKADFIQVLNFSKTNLSTVESLNR